MEGNRKMPKDNNIAICVEHVDKSFNVFYDKTNTIKEKILFWNMES